MKNKLKMKWSKEKGLKWLGLCVSVLGLTLVTTIPAYASTNTYAESGAKWLLDGIYWFVVACGILGVGKCAIQRNITGALTTFIMTALIAVICKNPEILTSLGNTLKGILGL